MGYRRTLKRTVGCTGIGLHSGKPVRLELRPAPAGHGIRFRRSRLRGRDPRQPRNLARLDHATTLSRDGVSIDTVEHLLSALHGLGVDDVLVEVDGPEVPILDGSAAPFVILVHEAGLRPLPVQRQYLKVLEPLEVVRGDKWVRLLPADHFRVSYTIGFDHPLLRHQWASFRLSPDTFAEADRASPHLRVPPGSGDAAQERARARRKPRQRHRHRGDGRAQQQAPLRGRVRPPQGPRRYRRLGAPRVTRFWATSRRRRRVTPSTPLSPASSDGNADGLDPGPPAAASRRGPRSGNYPALLGAELERLDRPIRRRPLSPGP